MIIKKSMLSRRAVLRGLGVAVGLPLLDAMVPAATAITRTAAAARPRLGFFYTPSGMILNNFRPTTAADGRIVELSPILSPLAPVRSHMVAVTGLSHARADEPLLGSGPHTRSAAVWLSGVRPKRTEGADVRLDKTLDQYAADKLGVDTPLASLELALDDNFVTGNCDNGYSCVYLNTFSWRTPTTPLPMEINPRAVFERLFGYSDDVSSRARQLQRDRSLLDWVTGSVSDLRGSLGPGDRAQLDEYLSAIRDVEKRIQVAERQSATTPLPVMARPAGVPDSYPEHAELMLDLMLLAYQADITRVVSLQLNREQSATNFPFIGVPEQHHEASHHGGVPEKVDKFTKVNTYHVSLVARLAQRLQETPDGDGTLLDHSILLLGSGMGDGSIHSPHDLPNVLVGGACGQLRGDRHLAYPLDTPMMNMGLSLLDKVGVELESIGDSTGRLPGL